jgi:cytochrome c551/c552
MRCPACGKAARTWRIVLLLDGSGALKGRKVCQGCHDGGVTVVAPVLAPVVQADRAERRAQAEVLAPFVRNLEAKLRARKGGSGNVPGSPEDCSWTGYDEALEDVVALLKSGRA